MGSWDGNYSRDMTVASRRKQYVFGVHQQGLPVADADINDSEKLQYEKLRSFIEKFGGDSFFFDASFEISGDGSDNDFQVGSGSGYVQGHETYLGASTSYANDGSTVEDINLHSVSSALSATVLTDSSMNWNVNELAGRLVVPDVTEGTPFLIVSNTVNTVTVTGDMTTVAGVGDTYLVTLTTPSGSNRTDKVWLNVYVDEINAEEDPSLYHNLGTGVELALRAKIRTILMVQQGGSDYSGTYTDSDGNVHYVVHVATLNRTDGVAAISIGDVVDVRESSVSGEGGAGGRTVGVSSDDSTPADLESKIVAGTAITLVTLNPGANEQLQISASGAAFTDELVKISATDTTEGLLAAKIAAGTGIALSTINSPGNEQLQISATMSAVVLDGGLTDDATLPLAPLDGVTLFWEKIDISSGAAGLIIQVMGTNLTGWTQSVHQRLIFDLQNDLYIGSGQGGAILTWTAIPAWTPATTTKYLLWSDGVNRMTSMLKYVHGDGLWVGNYNVSSNRNGSYIWHTF